MYRLRVMRLLRMPANSRSIIAHQCQRIAINVLAQCTLLACLSWKHSAALCATYRSRPISYSVRSQTVGGRLQVGDLSEFARVRCILTMQLPSRWWNARDYVVASSLSQPRRSSGHDFPIRRRPGIESRSIFHPRVLAVRTKYKVYHFSIAICYRKKGGTKAKIQANPRLNIYSCDDLVNRTINYVRNRYRKSRFILEFVQILYKFLARCIDIQIYVRYLLGILSSVIHYVMIECTKKLRMDRIKIIYFILIREYAITKHFNNIGIILTLIFR